MPAHAAIVMNPQGRCERNPALRDSNFPGQASSALRIQWPLRISARRSAVVSKTVVWQIAAIAEIGAAERFDAAVGVADEDAVGVEDGDAEVALELAEESEHAVDRAAGGLAALVDGDGEETVRTSNARAEVTGAPCAAHSIEKAIDVLRAAAGSCVSFSAGEMPKSQVRAWSSS